MRSLGARAMAHRYSLSVCRSHVRAHAGVGRLDVRGSLVVFNRRRVLLSMVINIANILERSSIVGVGLQLSDQGSRLCFSR